ncbi:aminoglycoside phosphotransferase family protein [Nocardia sp. NPDC051832]|uniref:phosphotransferase family protein n=1 Tax=Nocardia sp. NPDC051832 TaxID=3155673 RepID=UPI003426D74D
MATHITAHRIADLHRVVELACARVGLNPVGAELIKYTVNAVFRLPLERVVVRVACGAGAAVRGHRAVATARWLHKRNAPVAALLDCDQPVDVDGGHSVTFWRELERRPEWTPADLAAPLLALHSLAPDIGLPRWNPFLTARDYLRAADVTAVPAADLRWLTGQWALAEYAYRYCETDLPVGVVHGDPHTGNLLVRADGRIVLCDLDEVGIGPLAWDLVPQAVGAVRFGRREFHREFVRAYGSDVRNRSCWPVLARIRELMMVTGVLPDLGNRPTVAAQFAHRFATLRAGQANSTWQVYA